jgi:catechol 2,3-dioxygenase-like lactoylglutathione lyase family enzyme
MSAGPTVDELVVADEPSAWEGVGFRVGGDLCEVGSVRVRLDGSGPRRGIVRWSLREARSLDLDGLDTLASDLPLAAGGKHPNGVISIDHLVVLTPDLERTTAAFEAAGLDLRRVREGPTPGGSERQAFFRMGELILEVVLAPEGTKIADDPTGPARLWGISFLVEDMDEPVAFLGERLGSPRDAVQPGRRIATLRTEGGLGPAIAFMTPGRGAIADFDTAAHARK